MGKALAAQSSVETLEYTLLTADGRELDAESNIDILRDCSGQVVGLIITARDVTERKRMQEAVRASEEKLTIMFESISDGIIVTDLLGNITEANDAAAAMTGYPREKVIGMNGLELISPEYHQMAAEVMGKVIDGEQATGSLELKFVTADGAEVDAEFSTSMLYDGDGNATGFVSIARDIGERKRMEAELEKSAEKLRLVIESIGDMLFITDLDLNFSNVNEAAVRQLGYTTQEELAGKNAMEPVVEEDRNRVAIELGKALAEERGIEIIEYSLQAVDGRKFDVEANAEILRDCSNTVVGLILSARDVTERKQMQEAIRDSEEKLRGIFDTIPDGVTFTDMTGIILDLNEAMVRMYGHSNKEDLIGRNAIDFVAKEYHDAVVLLGMNAIKEGHDIDRIEYRLIDAAGKEFDAEFFAAPLRDSSGEPVAWVNVSRDITERKEAERAVRESERRFRTIFESIVDGLTVTDLNGNIVDMNEAALQLHGYKDKQELIGKNTIEYMVAEVDRERTINEALEAIKEDRPLKRAEYRLQRADGTEFDGEFSTAILRDDDGKPTGHIGMTRDITERKQAEEAIRQSEEKLRLIFENIGEGITLSDLEGKIIDINEAAVLKGGYSSKEELIGRDGFEMVSPEDRERVSESVVQALKEGRSTARLECKFSTAAGGEYDADLSISALRDRSGKLAAFIALSRDITERKQAEEALRQSEEKLRLTFEAMGDAVTVTDLEGNILEINELAYTKAGYDSKEEMLGKNGFDLVSPEDRDRITESVVQAMKEGLGSVTMECSFHPIKGDDYQAELTISVIRDTSGKPTGFIAITRDITERKKAEEAVRQSEEKLRLMFASLSEGIIVTDMAGVFLDVNEALLRISGYSRKEDLIGKSALDLVAPEEHERIIAAFSQKLDPDNIDKMMDYEIYNFIAPDGSKREAEFTGNLMHDGDGNPIGFIGVAHDISERRQAEEAIRQSEEKLRLMFESMRDAIVLTDTTGTIVEVNDAAVRMHGFSSREEIIGRNGIELVAESDRKKVAEAAIKQSKGEVQEGVVENHMLRRADGTEFESESSRAILRDAEGNTTGFISVERDITERRQAEEAVRESEERLKAFIDNAPDAIYVMDINKTFMDGNRKAEELVGYAKEDLVGTNFFEAGLLPEEYALQALGSLQQSQDGEATVPTEFELIRKDGSRVWVEVRSIPLSRKGEVEVLGIARDITERKRAAKALEDSESRFRELFENMSSAVAVYEVKNKGKDFIFKDLNSAGERISKLKKYDILGKNLVDIFPNIKKGGIYQAMKRVWKSGKPEYIPPTFYKDDRISGWRENYIYKLPTGEVVAVYDDVTERMQAEEAIRESEEKLRTMFDSTNDAFCITDLETNITDVNEAAIRMFKYTREEFIGLKGTELIDPKDLERTVESLSKSLETGQPPDTLELTTITGDGGRLETDLSIAPLHDSSGNTTGFVVAARDITERKRAEQAMRESEEKLRTMFESTSDGILVTDQALSIIEANEAAARMLGFDSKEALVGQSAIQYMSTGGQTVAEEGGNGKIQLEFSVSQLRDSEGNTTGFIGVARDVTERKKAEAQMKRMLEDLERSNAELEQFAYIASHDLQEPLRMISSYTQLIGRRYKDKLDADGEEFIEYAVDGATRMQDRIQALLTYSRVGTRGKEFESTDCEDVLEQALANLQVAIKKSGAVITHDPPADGASRRDTDGAAVPEPDRERHQIPGREATRDPCLRQGAGRGLAVLLPRQRHRHRPAV